MTVSRHCVKLEYIRVVSCCRILDSASTVTGSTHDKNRLVFTDGDGTIRRRSGGGAHRPTAQRRGEVARSPIGHLDVSAEPPPATARDNLPGLRGARTTHGVSLVRSQLLDPAATIFQPYTGAAPARTTTMSSVNS